MSLSEQSSKAFIYDGVFFNTDVCSSRGQPDLHWGIGTENACRWGDVVGEGTSLFLRSVDDDATSATRHDAEYSAKWPRGGEGSMVQRPAAGAVIRSHSSSQVVQYPASCCSSQDQS